MPDEKTYKEVHQDLKKKGVTNISYDKYRDRLQTRNEATKKKEYQERKIIL